MSPWTTLATILMIGFGLMMMQFRETRMHSGGSGT